MKLKILSGSFAVKDVGRGFSLSGAFGFRNPVGFQPTLDGAEDDRTVGDLEKEIAVFWIIGFPDPY
jgi:hypothetical protein